MVGSGQNIDVYLTPPRLVATRALIYIYGCYTLLLFTTVSFFSSHNVIVLGATVRRVVCGVIEDYRAHFLGPDNEKNSKITEYYSSLLGPCVDR